MSEEERDIECGWRLEVGGRLLRGLVCFLNNFSRAWAFFLAFLALLFAWEILTLIGMLSSKPGGKRGPEERDDDLIELLGFARGAKVFEVVRGEVFFLAAAGLDFLEGWGGEECGWLRKGGGDRAF